MCMHDHSAKRARQAHRGQTTKTRERDRARARTGIMGIVYNSPVVMVVVVSRRFLEERLDKADTTNNAYTDRKRKYRRSGVHIVALVAHMARSGHTQLNEEQHDIPIRHTSNGNIITCTHTHTRQRQQGAQQAPSLDRSGELHVTLP